MSDIYTSMDNDVPPGCGCHACERAKNGYDQDALGDPYYDPIEPPDGGNNDPDNLYSGSVWNNDGTGLTLYYNFWNALPSYYNGGDDEANGFKAFTAQMEAATEAVLDQIESFTNITFVETTNEGQTHLGFAQANLDPDVGAWAYYPHPNPKGGDVWTNRQHVSETSLPEGGYSFYTLLHEVGHALGLQHTFDAGFTGAQNTEQYSVMAYDWSPWGGTFAETYMLYDIYVLQQLYGTNNNYNTGNNTYTLVSGEAKTIWDAGGTDLLDGSAIGSSMTLNLDAGTFSSIGLTENFAIAYGVTIENADGGSAGDIIYGNDVANVINGNGGNDTIHGSQGDDTLDGGAGSGDEVVYTSDIADFLFTFVNATTVIVQDIVGSFGTDTLSNFETFTFDGTSYDWQGIQDNGTSSELGEMDVRFRWNDSASQFKITSNEISTDTYTAADMSYAGENGSVFTTYRGFGTLTVTVWQDVDLDEIRLDGTENNDTILVDGTNSDVLTVINGYAGADTITVEDLGGYASINGGDGNDVITGANGNDQLYGNNDNDTIYGLYGQDNIYGGAGEDELYGGNLGDNLYGGDDDDILSGDAGDDFLYGENGNDTLYGGNGVDRLEGGAGEDVLDGFDGNDILIGDDGDDTLHGGDNDDLLYGLADNDTLNGDNGNDTLYGGAGADELNGGNQHDELHGEDGNDTLNGDDGDDSLYGEAGQDALYGGNGNDVLSGGADNDSLYGEVNRDHLYGGDGDDLLDGGGAKDRLYGGNGNDTLIGAQGKDVLFGEGGSDVFGFTTLDGNVDIIKDFTLSGGEQDALNITDLLSGYQHGVSDINDFVLVNNKGKLYVDANGGGGDDGWSKIALIQGSDFTGVTVDDLVASGQLIANQTLL